MVEKYECKRCGHEWTRRSKGRPKACPSCRSPHWDRLPLPPWKGRGYEVQTVSG